ncbi:MAG: helix-turn-helix domain-containing protein [Fusicatenibacter saccharivorans]
MQKGIKFRIYPNREQKNFIHQTLGCCRLIYNRGLAMRKESYEEGKKIGYTQTSAMLTELKRQEEFAFFESSRFHCLTAVSAGSRPELCEFLSKTCFLSNLQEQT